MVAMGLAIFAITVISFWLRWRWRLYHTGWFLRFCTYAAPVGFIAIIAGWVTTEVGRQPWVYPSGSTMKARQ